MSTGDQDYSTGMLKSDHKWPDVWPFNVSEEALKHINEFHRLSEEFQKEVHAIIRAGMKARSEEKP